MDGKQKIFTAQIKGAEVKVFEPGYRMIHSGHWVRLYFPYLVFIIKNTSRHGSFMQLGMSPTRPDLNNLCTPLIRMPTHGNFYGDTTKSFMLCCRPDIGSFWTTSFIESPIQLTPLRSFLHWSRITPEEFNLALLETGENELKVYNWCGHDSCYMKLDLGTLLDYESDYNYIQHVNSLK